MLRATNIIVTTTCSTSNETWTSVNLVPIVNLQRYKSAVWYHNDEQKKMAESRLQDVGRALMILRSVWDLCVCRTMAWTMLWTLMRHKKKCLWTAHQASSSTPTHETSRKHQWCIVECICKVLLDLNRDCATCPIYNILYIFCRPNRGMMPRSLQQRGSRRSPNHVMTHTHTYTQKRSKAHMLSHPLLVIKGGHFKSKRCRIIIRSTTRRQTALYSSFSRGKVGLDHPSEVPIFSSAHCCRAPRTPWCCQLLNWNTPGYNYANCTFCWTVQVSTHCDISGDWQEQRMMLALRVQKPVVNNNEVHQPLVFCCYQKVVPFIVLTAVNWCSRYCRDLD